MIFLVLSLALNFFLWRWGDTQATESTSAGDRLRTVQSQVQEQETQLSVLKSMLGTGGFTEAEIENMRSNLSSDEEMQAIEARFVADMAMFGPDVEASERNYPALPSYLVNALRAQNELYASARADATKIRVDAEQDISTARSQQEMAEQQRDDANKKVVTLGAQFDEDRARMNKEKEDTKDKLNQTVQDMNKFRKTASAEAAAFQAKSRKLQGTIDTQKLRLNELIQDKFETTQGEIRYVVHGGNITTINLGSKDALRPGVTFGVIGADETRLEDAKVKATIQVTQIQGPHLAKARVVARPEIKNPIIPGDKIYSPFWAPGRVVKIALAGEIDIDGDNRPDNDQIKGQIKAAGAMVAAEVSPTGAITGNLDATIRFLVIGAPPETGEKLTDAQAAGIEAMGDVKNKARELGLTIIPAWKLQSYLKTIDDTLTTPFGSAVRGEDFPPESARNLRRMPSDIAEMYKSQRDNVQKGNKILP
jgi:hypothetical protein